MNTHKASIPVTIIMPMRNGGSTVLSSLKAIQKQQYPIKEILVIDNASSDNSVDLVEGFKRKSRIPIKVFVNRENKGIGSSLNLGVKKAKTKLVIFMHSDCFLDSPTEIDKLVAPFMRDPEIVASCPTIVLDRRAWDTYGFWEKSFFVRGLDKETPGLTTKFDCFRRDAFIQVGGFDMENFGVGGEDADLDERLKKVGKVVLSDARVTHLHFLGEGYTIDKLLAKQRVYARIYGRLVRIRGLGIFRNGIIFLVRPTLAVLPFIPNLHGLGILLLILYSFAYSRKMFTMKSTLTDPRILLLPLYNIFLVYYETFWMIEAFLFGKHKIE